MREKGIIVRPMGGYGLPSCLRITVGLETHMRQTLEAGPALESTLDKPVVTTIRR